MPGVYKPSCLAKPASSAARIWVNDRGTQKAGRCIWGLTKVRACKGTGSGCLHALPCLLWIAWPPGVVAGRRPACSTSTKRKWH